MNCYSKQTLRGGAHSTANGPYGSSRGNRVLQAKRVNGPSAQTLLCIAANGERCRCGKPASISVTQDNGAIKRACTECAFPAPVFLDRVQDTGQDRCPIALRAAW